MRQRNAILLTGASGVLGRAILREIAGRRPVISLTHRGGTPMAGADVIPCNIAARHCGLSDEDYKSVTGRIIAVVHAAALTEWGLPKDRYDMVNVRGTRHVVELAADAAVPVHFVSSAFVAAMGGAAPAALPDTNITLEYVRSKRAGELMLAECGLPYTVYRPTNLIGDSLSGRTARPQIVQFVSDWVCRGRTPIFPARPDDRLDVVPQDLLAKVIVHAVAHGRTGGEYWVTRGARAMTVRTAIEILMAHAATVHRPVVRPRLVPPPEITPAEIAALSPTARRFVRVLSDLWEVVRACGGVLPSSMPLLASRFGLTSTVSDVEAYRRTLRAAGPPA